MREALRELSTRRGHAAVLVLCAIAVLLHQLVRSDWFIDDAAICFAYARNLADGEGLVVRPGGERIEGFSDPTWIALLALFELVGLDGFTTAKPLGALCSILTLPIVWRTARIAMPDHDGPAPLFAPLFLATNAQLALWSTSGLENGLFVFLLSAAILHTVTDAATGRTPWNAVWWLLLTWTRPEGALYAWIGGAWFVVWVVRDGRPRRLALVWLAIVGIPSAVLELLRVWYFAWPVPNTWYAKIDVRETKRFSWDARGWIQVRDWTTRTWGGWLAPVFAAGLVGTRGRSAMLAFGAFALLAASLLWDGPTPYRWARVGLIVGVTAGAPWWASWNDPSFRPRVLCWHAVWVGIVFSVYADGDWMGGFRWMSLFVAPLSVLFACGVREIADRVEEVATGSTVWSAAGWLTSAVLVSSQLPPQLTLTRDHLLTNTNETPHRVKRRLDYTSQIARRLFVDEPIVNLEMDMGAHLFWRPRSIDVDMAGLVDIAMSRHTYKDRAFIEHYVFGERRPMFGHVHTDGWWGRYSAFATYGAWQDGYFELPPYPEMEGYPTLSELHPGEWARRDLLMTSDTRPDPSRTVSFEGGPTVLGFDVPTPWGAGHRGYLEMRVVPPSGDPPPRFRLIAFLARGDHTVASWELPMGQGLLPIAEWRDDEAFFGRFALPVPADVPPGTYDLGVVALRNGTIRARKGDGDVPPPAFARGEARWEGRVEVVAADEIGPRAGAALDRAVATARGGDCSAAEEQWRLARRHVPWDDAWDQDHAPAAESALATCWADRAATDPDGAPAHLARAHRWDHRDPRLRDVGAAVGDRLWDEGVAARKAEDWATAYDRFSALLGFQPWRAWARRYAEEARDEVLSGA
jgi:hypothetical protein